MREQYTPDSFVAQVGIRIRTLRTEQRLSLRELGKKADVHPFHVMAIELGQMAANLRTLRRIAAALGVEPSDLLNNPDDDVGAIFELMRVHPESAQAIRLRVTHLVVN